MGKCLCPHDPTGNDIKLLSQSWDFEMATYIGSCDFFKQR